MQINLNILTENNHSSLLSKNVPTADNALLQYMQKVTQGTNNADTEDKKQQKLQHIVNKLKHGKKLTAQEMEFLRMNYPDEYQHALRIQKMAEMLENQLKHAKSKQEADGYIAAAVSGIRTMIRTKNAWSQLSMRFPKNFTTLLLTTDFRTHRRM